MDTTSASLLERVRRLDDADAWGRFVRTYSPILYSWARRFGLSHDDAGELTQDVFAVLVQKLPEFEYNTDKQFRGWLWTVTRRRWMDRKRRAALPLDPRRDPAEVPASAASDADTLEEQADHPLGDVEVGDRAAAQRPHGDDVPGRPPDHLPRVMPGGQHLTGLAVQRDHGRLPFWRSPSPSSWP